MTNLLMALWHMLRRCPDFLKIETGFYRRGRLFCHWLEEIHPEISQRAGFAYDLAWLGNLEESPWE